MGTSNLSPAQLVPTQQVTVAPKSGSLLKFLNRQHADYELKKNAWLDLRIMYEGGVLIKKFADRFLQRRPKEPSDVYFARLERFTYQNILGTALGWYVSEMFHDEPEILFNGKTTDNFYTEKFLPNCDNAGTSFVNFSRKVFVDVMCAGEAYVLIDLPSSDGPSMTLLEQKEKGLLNTRLVKYNALDVTNWQLDSAGNFDWVIVKTTTKRQEFMGPLKEVDNWYYFNKTEFKVFERIRDESVKSDDSGSDDEVQLVRQGNHCLSKVNKVPLIKCALNEGLWLANKSYLLLLDHLNQDNSLSWALFMSNLAMPVIIGDVDASGQSMSEAGYLQFPSGTQYTWSEPEGKSFQISANRIESLREEAYRSMYLQAQGRSMSATPAMQSGRSKELDWMPSHDVIASMGKDVRAMMQTLLQSVIESRDEGSKLEADVRGFDFESDMTTEEVFATSSALNLKIPSKTFEKTVMKRIAKMWCRDSNPDVIEKITKEIDAGPTIAEQAQMEEERRAKLATQARVTASAGVPQPPGKGGGNQPKPSKN